MKTINVEITGTSSLLMHSAENMEFNPVKKNPTKEYDKKKEAEKVAYRKRNKELYVPSRCLKACFINGASWVKFGKQSAKPIIAGCTRIEPIEIGLNTKKYEIDLRPVVIQNNRILRARPRLDKWKLNFKLIYNDEIIRDTNTLKEILKEAGQRVGLLDNRPQKYGENGTFEITKWEVEK